MNQDDIRQLNPERILYEDNHLIVVDKPAGIATMGTVREQPSLFDQVQNYIKTKYNKPGNVYLGVVSRIDMFVSGVITFAKTSKAASRVSEQFRNSQVKKNYYAVLEGVPSLSSIRQAGISMRTDSEPGYIEVNSWFRKNDRLRKVECFASEVNGAKHGQLNFKIMHHLNRFSLVSIQLITGRKHQIRSQFAELGCPVFGDRKYGASQILQNQIALHAHFVEFVHPTLKTKLNFTAPFPRNWKKNRTISGLLERI